jgi:hypothetical protein
MEAVAFLAIASMVMGIWGIFLTYRARDRVLIFRILMVATLTTSSFFIWMFFGRYFRYLSNGVAKTFDYFGEIKLKIIQIRTWCSPSAKKWTI